MAARSFEEDLSCPVCCGIFQNPVILMCSHSFCSACLRQYWEQKGASECPVCRSTSPVKEPPCNLVLKNLCETFLWEMDQKNTINSGLLCGLHKEKLKLYCLVDDEPLCVDCLTGPHEKHNFCRIGEIASDRKEELRASMRVLQEMLEGFNTAKQICDEMADHIKGQVQQTEKQIKEEFKKLHQYLLDEEVARISALQDEAEQKFHTVRELAERMLSVMSTLSDTVTSIEQELGKEDISFLLNYKGTKRRAQCTVTVPSVPSGVLIDVAQHLGNLKHRAWESALRLVQHTPVILDPNTAHPSLQLSEDLTSVKHGERQQLPDNPERFDTYVWVLGSEGFSSGRHCWDVEVGDKPSWTLGVAVQPIERKGRFVVGPGEGLWVLRYRDGNYKTLTSAWKPLASKRKPQRIRVQLNWDQGKLSFSDASDGKTLFQYECRFTEKVLPVFFPGPGCASLKVCPTDISVE